MFRSQIARSANEFLLLVWLSFKPAGWTIVVSVSRHSSGAHDSNRAGDSGDESPELSRSAAGREHVRSTDLSSRPPNALGHSAFGAGFAKAECDPGESGRR